MKNNKIKRLLGKPSTKYEIFHRSTNFTKSLPYDASTWPSEWGEVFFKEYPRFDKIVLPKPFLPTNISLKKALLNRQSIREFGRDPLTLSLISTLLYYSAGLKSFSAPWRGNRFYPSAGSRYPLEVYLLSINSELGNRLYHYQVRTHSLEIIKSVPRINTYDYFYHEWEKSPSFIIIFTAHFTRTTMKYQDRGYRYLLSETGNLSQNFYLLSTALNIATTATGYVDTKVNKLLNINGIDEAAVYAMVFGSKPTSGNM